MVSKRTARALIGVAGWTIPARFASSFKEDGTHLQRYARVLKAVEINSSFRRSHSRATYERWAASVPREFRFGVKVPFAFTHESALRPPKGELDEFIDAVTGLGARLGALLVQLPPSHEFNPRRARAFFEKLRDRASCALVCEPRHSSWSCDAAEALMSECRVSRVAADPPLWDGGDLPSGDREHSYFRLHGSPRRYYSEYSPEQLQLVRARIEAAGQESRQVWCIFDNTASGAATGNALRLSQMLDAAAP